MEFIAGMGKSSRKKGDKGIFLNMNPQKSRVTENDQWDE